MGEWLPLGAVALHVDDGAQGLVDVYEAEDGARYEVRPPRREWPVHPHAVPLPGDWEDGREVERHRCDCRSATTLVRVVVCSDGNRWALIRPESMPQSARMDGRREEDLAAPLHTDAHGVPHSEVTGCRRCRSRWLTLLYEDEVRMVRLHRVAHKVTPTTD